MAEGAGVALDEVRVAPAPPGIEEALAEMRDRCMRESLVAAGRYDPVRVRQRLLADYDPDQTHVLTHPKWGILGFFCLRPETDGGYLKHLYIDLPHQGSGLGRWALGWIEAHLGGGVLRLNALRGSRANAFYRQNGFRLTGSDEFDHFYEKSLPGVLVEELGPEDLDHLVELRLEVLRAANGLPETTALTEVREATRGYFQPEEAWRRCRTLVAKIDGQLAGCGSVVFLEVLPTVSNPTGRRAYIMNMYTRPGFRRRGIAGQVLQRLLDLAQAEGITRVSLESTEAGQALYRRAGFVPMPDEREIDLTNRGSPASGP